MMRPEYDYRGHVAPVNPLPYDAPPGGGSMPTELLPLEGHTDSLASSATTGLLVLALLVGIACAPALVLAVWTWAL